MTKYITLPFSCRMQESDYLPFVTCVSLFVSAGLERDKRHLSSVVSIKILPESNPDDSAKTTTDQTPTQVSILCSENYDKTHCFVTNFVFGDISIQ